MILSLPDEGTHVLALSFPEEACVSYPSNYICYGLFVNVFMVYWLNMWHRNFKLESKKVNSVCADWYYVWSQGHHCQCIYTVEWKAEINPKVSEESVEWLEETTLQYYEISWLKNGIKSELIYKQFPSHMSEVICRESRIHSV